MKLSRKKIFYVVQAKEYDIQESLNTIVFLADQAEKNQAHITVRGPYSQSYAFAKQNKVIEGKNIKISGVGAFFNTSQCTVFLKVISDDLKKVWHKPKYPLYTPHLTIYDGTDKAYAERLLKVIASLEIEFEFTSTKLIGLLSTKGQYEHILQSSIDFNKVSREFDIEKDSFLKYTMTEEIRLELIKKIIIEKLANNRCSWHSHETRRNWF